MKIGSKITHPIHGEGKITLLSPDSNFAVCEYPKPNGGTYKRTHPLSNIKETDNGNSPAAQA